MSRNLTANALNKIAEQVGTEPIVVIDIKWTSTTWVRYADKKIDSSQGLILEVSNLNQTVNLNGSNSVASIDVVLDDTDSFIKNTINSNDIHRVECIVYQYFSGLTIDDKFELFRGELVSPITWSEGERTVSFSIVTRTNSYEVGFAPEEGQFIGIEEQAIGKVWPLCFGQPIHVPAQIVSNVISGTLISLFTIPDFTLTYKKTLLNARLDKLVAAYALYQGLIAKCQKIARPAYDIQDDYADRIVAYDHIRQVIEDSMIDINHINKQIDTLTNEYFGVEAESQSSIKTKIKNLKTTRDDQVEILKEHYAQKRDHEKFFEHVDTEIDNCKYKLTVINKLRKKCRDLINQYYQTLLDIQEVSTHISEQYQNYTNPLSVIYGTSFPQGQEVTINMGGNLLKGSFTNNAFSLNRIKPIYDSVELITPQDQDKDAIWLKDSSLKLGGKYVWLNNNRIVKVTNQNGAKCTIQLPRKNKNLRSNAKDFDYEGSTKDQKAIQEGLKRLLTGNETPAQFNDLANKIPKDLSPEIRQKLYGDNNTQTITLVANGSDEYIIDFAISYFTLIYGKEEETDKIYFTDTADEIKNKILASTISITDNDIEVEITKTRPSHAEHFVELKITINNLMSPFRINKRFLPMPEWKFPNYLVIKTEDKTPTKVVLTFSRDEVEQYCKDNELQDQSDGNGTIGSYIFAYNVDIDTPIKFSIILGTKICSFNIETTTGTDIQNKLESEGITTGGEITVTGGPLETDDIEFAYAIPFRGFLVDCQDLEVTAYDKKGNLINLVELGIAKLKLTIEGANAFEYTKAQRQAKLDDEVENNVNAPAIKKQRDAIRSLLVELESATDEAELTSLKQDLQANLSSYKELIKKIDQGDYQTELIYKAISDDEHDKLFELEVTGYLEWVNKYRDLDLQLEDNDYEFDNTTITAVKGVANQPLLEWIQWIDAIQDPFLKLREIEILPDNTSAYYGYLGEKVSLEGAYQTVYVANLLPSTVNAVYAHRNVAGINRLVPVPSSYYTKNESNAFGPYNCTTISLYQPLQQIDSSWQEGLYVTLTSSIGPNVADIIQWVVEHYTLYSVDATSFAHVRSLLVNYPANFALFDKRDALSLIEDIAWQSRCSLKIRGHTIYMRYLPEEPDSVDTITEDDVEEKSLALTFTDTEEIITKFTATYKPHYAATKPWSIILRRNLAKYYTNTQERDFFIYNIKDLVYKSATFWIIRKGNTYKKAIMKLFLNKLNLDVDDCVTLDFNTNYFSTDPVKGIIEQCSYNSDSHSLDCVVWLPIVSGSMIPDAFAWPKDMSVQLLYPLNFDISGGNVGSVTGIKVPTNLDFDPVDDIDIRPKDFGTSKLSDIDDELPQNPANEFEELDYDPTDPVAYKLPDEINPDVDARTLEWEIGHGKKIQIFDPKDVKVGIGRVIGKGKTEDVDLESIEGADTSTAIIPQFYKVQLTNGKVVEARPVHYNDKIDLPYGLATIVVYDEVMQEYQFQPPIFVNEEEVPDP